MPSHWAQLAAWTTLLASPCLAALSQQAEAPSGPIRVSGGVMAGNILSMVSPIFPQDGCAAHASGAVVMGMVIGKEGRVKSAEALSGHPILRQPYLEAARQYTFKPYLLNGQPVEVQTTLVINPSINCGETQPTASPPEPLPSDALSKPLHLSGCRLRKLHRHEREAESSFTEILSSPSCPRKTEIPNNHAGSRTQKKCMFTLINLL